MEKPARFSRYASVILDSAIPHPLDYGIPEGLLVKKGMQVQVPVRGHLRYGYVLALQETSPHAKVLPIQTVLSEAPLLTEELFELAIWMSTYYATPLSQVIKTLLPSSVRNRLSAKQQYYVTRKQSKKALRAHCQQLRMTHPTQAAILDLLLQTHKGILLTELLEKTGASRSPVQTLVNKELLHLEQIAIDRSPLIGHTYFKTAAKPLNEEQAAALEKIKATLTEKRFETHLLFGVTGSGKTEVYLQAIEHALSLTLGTIMLVPEIALTSQTIERLCARFDKSIAVLHHRLSEGERHDAWHRIYRGEARIVIGARSALFSPVHSLGLIIVDEEHDGAYKQEEQQPSYHARDVAVVRGKFARAAVVLGTATPSLESYYNTQSGKYTLSILGKRATASSLPAMEVIDMRPEYDKARGYTPFSSRLIEEIKKRIHEGEQTILFLNRRGYHTSLSCLQCGYIFTCPHCDVALTFHRGDHLLSCHLCDHRLTPPPTRCLSCHAGETLKYRGIGTEQVERALHALFPEIRTLRADGDTMRHKGSHERLFHAFSTGKADVLIGTQMIAKGLHFPSVTLVAILNGDASLHIPDFRATERLFQLITQVAGRAGRGELPGKVLIQTCAPDNPAIQQAASQDYVTFYDKEIGARQLFCFPPFSHLVKLIFSGLDALYTQKAANQIRLWLIQKLPASYCLHPVVPSGYAKIKNYFRFQCLIRGRSVTPIVSALPHAPPLPKEITMHVDIDPLTTFF